MPIPEIEGGARTRKFYSARQRHNQSERGETYLIVLREKTGWNLTLSSGEGRMQTNNLTKRAVVAATAASFALAAAPAVADDLGLRIGSGAALSTLPSSGNLTGTGVGIGANGNAGLDLNTVTDDQISSTKFQSRRLIVPDALDHLSIKSDTKGKASVFYNFVDTKF
jgi:hypothetical protein